MLGLLVVAHQHPQKQRMLKRWSNTIRRERTPNRHYLHLDLFIDIQKADDPAIVIPEVKDW
jgi:hypothetical protein